MKRLLLILILTFSFQSWTKADDISEFEIEGISIGDSLLDYFSVSEIKNFYNYDNLPSNMKFRIAEFYQENYNKMEQYDGMQVYYKPEDKNFIIYGLNGNLFCLKRTECKKLYNKIKSDMSKNFSGRESTHKHTDDKSGKSIVTMYSIQIEDGSIIVSYNDWSEEVKWKDNVSVEILSSEVDKWIQNNWGLGSN